MRSTLARLTSYTMTDYPRIPPLALGYIFPVASLVYEFETLNDPDPNEFVFSITLTILASWYFVWHVYLLHRLIHARFEGRYPITARWAALAHFIPIYNAYWLYKWPQELSEFLLHKAKRHAFNTRLIHILTFGGPIVLKWFDYAIGFAIFWTAMVIMIRSVKRLGDSSYDSLEANRTPSPDHATTLSEAWPEDIRERLKIPKWKR